MFYINVILVSIILIVYIYNIGLYIYYWNETPTWQLDANFQATTSITVIIAARNEEKNIAACLEAISTQDYPSDLVEFLLINDHSEDQTAAIAASFTQVHCLHLPKGKMGKKSAIQFGISHSKNQLIVTTDADCTMSPLWLQYIAHIYEQTQAKLIAAPVSFVDTNNSFEQFQALDFMGMMAVAAAGIKGQFMNMCNGANLAYERLAFEKVNGFEGINHLASGDDMLLLEKIAQKYPQQIVYLKQTAAQTLTQPKRSIKGFVQQRIRWATKSGSYQNWQTQAMLANVWLLCWAKILLLAAAIFYGDSYFWILFLLVFGGKMLLDYVFLSQMATFFGRRELLRNFIPAVFWHWWYIVYIGTASLFVKQYNWKNRNVR